MKGRPWGMAQIQMSVSGLRECVLRVGYMPLDWRPTIMFARWKLEEPTKFKELLQLVKGTR